MKAIRIICVAACVMFMAGCKPTEKNYQAAYEAAQNKKKAASAVDPDMVVPAGGLQRLDAPRTKEVGGVKLNIKRFPIKYVGEGGTGVIDRYNVAVAMYKMPTNAKAQTEDLVAKGYKAFAVEGNDGYFYVVGGSFASLEEAAAFVKDYQKNNKAEQLVGLEGEPLVIEH